MRDIQMFSMNDPKAAETFIAAHLEERCQRILKMDGASEAFANIDDIAKHFIEQHPEADRERLENEYAEKSAELLNYLAMISMK